MRTKQEIARFITEMMREKGVTKSQLGAVLGATGITQLKVQKANQFLNPNNPKIHLADLVIVADLLGLSPRQILLKEGQAKATEKALKSAPIDEKHLVPFMPDRAITQVEWKDDQFPQWLVFPFAKNAKKYLAARINGHEMEPLFSPGTIAFVDTRTHHYDLNNKLVLARYKDEKMVRRLKRDKKGNIELHAEAPTTKALCFTPDDDLEIIGIVTHVMQSIL